MTEFIHLSKDFTLAEMLRSEVATRRGFTEQFMPPIEVVRNLELLTVNILQPLRDVVRSQVHISSAYRCARVNKAVNGARNSQHMVGQAADILNYEYGNEYLFRKIQELDLPFDQLINEFSFAWVHVSFGPQNRKQILEIK